MYKNMFESNGAASTQAPWSEINSSEQQMPIIPILNSNTNPGINDSCGYHLQDLMPAPSNGAVTNNPGIKKSSAHHSQEMTMPVPSSNAMVADNNNINHEFSLMLENPLMNQGHRRFYSDPTFSNNAIYFASNICIGIGGAAYAYGKSAVIFDDLDDETLSEFSNVNEPCNSSVSMTSSQFGEKLNANIFRSVPTLPPPPPVPTSFDLGIGTSARRMEDSMQQHSQLTGKTAGISMLETDASSSSFTNNLVMESRRRHLSNVELAEIFRVDPRHAKRILANRKSAAKQKEKKEKYKAELEDKVQFLQARVASLRAQAEATKCEVSSLTVENKRLGFQLEAAEQNYRLKGALNEVLNDEIGHLNFMALNAGIISQGKHIHPDYNNNTMHDLLMSQQLQQLQINNQLQELREQQIQDDIYIGYVSNVSSSDDNNEEN